MTTLITGASSGIGLELARIAAANRHDLVLVARREDKLSALARELRQSFGIKTEVVAADLADRLAPARLMARIEPLGLSIDVLVNNAGYGLYGRFAETSLDTELQMIQVNIAALTELTKRMVGPMVSRRQGRILNVASTAAFFPGPLMAVYYATKAYVLSFSEALANELQGTGVTVTALCPGPTASEFQATAKLEESRLVAGKMLATSAEVARFGWAAMMKGTVVAIPGASNRALVEATRLLPRAALRKIVRAAQERRA